MTTQKQIAARKERLRELGLLDGSRRCWYCKVALGTNTVQRLDGTRFCSGECEASLTALEQAEAARQGKAR